MHRPIFPPAPKTTILAIYVPPGWIVRARADRRRASLKPRLIGHARFRRVAADHYLRPVLRYPVENLSDRVDAARRCHGHALFSVRHDYVTPTR
jgi:hypothetical protein